MKKFLTLLTMSILALGYAYADDINVDFASLYGNATVQPATTVATNGVSISFAKGNSKTEPAWFVNDALKEMRLYGGTADAPAGNTMTITSSQAITKIVLNHGSNCTWAQLSADQGTVTVNATTHDATWTGNATSVTLTVMRGSESTQYRFPTAVITVDGTVEETVANPTFNPAAGTYYNPINVAIACGTSGANIYYTTDGTTPSASSTAYSEPIALSATTTIKAIAIKGEKQSEVAEAAYVFESATPVDNIAAYNKVEDNTMVQFTNPVIALAKNSNNLYVKDGSGYALIYGSTPNYKNGQTIPAGFIGKKITYNGMPELKDLVSSTFQAGVNGPEVAPEEIQCEDVSGDLWGHYVLIKGVHLSLTDKTITDASGKAPIHTGMGGYGNTTDTTKVWDCYAIIGSYRPQTADSTIFQVLPVKLVESGSVEPPVGDGITIAQFQELEDGTVTEPFNAVTVLAQATDKKRTFVKDETGYMLIYNNSGLSQTYSKGAIIPAGFTGKKTTWDGEPELATPFTGFQASTESTTVTAVEAKAAYLKHENFGHYIVVKNASISDGKIYDADNAEVAFYCNMGASLPSETEKTYDIYGIVGSHKNGNNIDYQLLPTEFKPTDGSDVELPEVDDVQALFELNKGTNARIKSDLVAIYQKGNRLFVKNNDTFTLVYGTLTETFENGDIIRDAVASWSEYQGAKQLVPVDSTFVVAEKGSPVEPVESVLEDMGQDMVHTYFIIKNAALTDSTITDETMTMKMFNQFEIDLTGIEEDAQYDVKGFLTVYKQELEIYPVEISKVGGEDPGVPGDVTGDGEVDIADVNAIINIMLQKNPASDYPGNADVTGDGGVDIADVNAVINIMLGK